MSKNDRSYPLCDDDTYRNHNIENFERCDGAGTLTGLLIEQNWFAVMQYLITHDFGHTSPLTILHVACTIPTIPIHVIHAIIKAYPDACLTEDEDGSLPIHVACSTTGISLPVIRDLMLSCPQSCLLRENIDGKIPLYLFLENNESVDTELVNHLIARLPASCIYNEITSLVHEVSKYTLPEAIMNQIIKVYPQVCKVKSKNGDTLLHTLCSQSYLTPKTLYMTLKHHPEACHTMDSNGNLPLHCISSGIHSESNIRILLNEYSKGIFTPNANSLIPLKTQHIRDLSTKAQLNVISHYDLLWTINHGELVPIQDIYYEMQCDLTCFITNSRRNVPLFLSPTCYPKLDNQIESLLNLITTRVYGRADAISCGRRLSIPHQRLFWTKFPLFTKILLQQSPLVAKKKDKYGELPLHLLVRQTVKNYHGDMIYQCSLCKDLPIIGACLWYGGEMRICAKCYSKSKDCFWNSPTMNILPLLEYQPHEVIKDAIKAYPQAASISDRFGNLPLHLSLHAGGTWETGVKEIFQAAPNAIYMQDNSSGLSPFMIAASKKNHHGADHHHTRLLKVEEIEIYDFFQKKANLLELTTVFELLRKNPSQVIV